MSRALILRFSSLFLVSVVIFCTKAFAQQDCSNAIQVCTPNLVQDPVGAGFGASQELNFPVNPTCLAAGEQNSTWFVFTVNAAGTLEFDITPSIYTDDYDWAIFNITTNGCGGIASGASPQVACNYSVFPGPTGMATGGEAITSATPLDSNYLAPVFLNANQTYVMVVNNSTLNTTGFNLDFTGSVSLLDNTTAEPLEILHQPCDQLDTLFVTLSEFVQCSSIAADGSDFTFFGPSVGYPFSAFGVNCGAAAFTNVLGVVLSSPIAQNGDYIFTIINGSDGNTLLDICGNPTQSGISILFTVTNLPQVNLGNDTAICDGDILTLDAGNPDMMHYWSTGQNGQTIQVVAVPTLISVTVDQNGCTASDSIFINSACFIYVPNAFSPNADGFNDVLNYIAPPVEWIQFSIYNRYGIRLFNSYDPNYGWDGTDGWDYKYASAVYVFRIVGVYESGKPFAKSGNITLLR